MGTGLLLHDPDRLRTAVEISRSCPAMHVVAANPQSTVPQTEDQPGDPARDRSSPSEASTADSAPSSHREGFHWTSVLNSISDIDSEKAGEPPEDHSSHVATALPQFVDFLLLGNYSRVSRADLIATVPPKIESDRLVTYYFDTYSYSPVILHRGEFMKQYEDFWQDPPTTSAPTSWLALLFSVLTLATILHNGHMLGSDEVLQPGTEKHQDSRRMESFREKTVQALVLSEHHKGGPHIPETLLHYILGEQFIRRDADSGTWIVLQSLVSIVLSFGYNKDPSHFQSLTPFEGEMRRRLWALIYQLDMGVSTQLKMPKLIKDSIVDTREPRNLFDTDFGPETTVLPESRPESELTPILITISKNRLASVSSKVLDAVTSKEPMPYTRVLELDSMLTGVFQELPACCKFTSMEESRLDPPNLTCQRLFIQLVYHHIQIILHSKYLAPSLKTDENQYSRDVAVAAAIQALRHQTAIDDEMEPNGRLYPVKWILAPVIIHEFLLAGGVLCSHISNNPQIRGTPAFENIKDLLTRSEAIWSRTAARSAEALKGATTIRKVLNQLEGSSRGSSCSHSESPENIVSPVTPQDVHVECQPSTTIFAESNEPPLPAMPGETDSSSSGPFDHAQNSWYQ
ncbi:unnamed protein product [Clonostachys solani]|uniref:Xylanolytic transcriptional activator regulatory domain-containing protein n=1 Tax=Clonostachys solani TaxID=160281 RepID=A0A9P0EK81_9HYPO|nr:unnamed protein product [Clonostachys solani]